MGNKQTLIIFAFDFDNEEILLNTNVLFNKYMKRYKDNALKMLKSCRNMLDKKISQLENE